MKTFKIDITKIENISNEKIRDITRGEMLDLVNTNKMYFIDSKGILMFISDGGFFESMQYDVTEYYYSTHTDEDTDFFLSVYTSLVTIMEVVDRDKEVEKRKNKTTRSKVVTERYKKFNLDDEDLSAIKDMSQSGSFGFHSIMDMFNIDYETFRMIEEDNSIKILQ